ncbi:MAG: RNA methyltransferase [Candidatus Methylopumilus sp.]|nr:RNA methyltransferase [Candidatus Methylopumilus sp.]
MVTTSRPLSRIRIVLCQTSHPGNIGATARAMKTMGITQLYLVTPKKFPHPEATALASGADDILNGAHVVNTLEEALHGVKLAIGLSARRRELTQPYLDIKKAAQEMIHLAHDAEVACVFGTEMSGLSNQETHLCQLLSFIDANPDYSSLNLAQAVQVVCHELRQASIHPEGASIYTKDLSLLADHDSLMGFLSHLEIVLDKIEFLDKVQGERLMQRLHILFARAQLETDEVNILRGILTQVQKKLAHSSS